MEFFNKYDKDWEQTKKLPKNENLHFYNVPQRAFEGHNTHNGKGRDGYGKWLADKDKGYENFSAPGYSFARRLQEKLKVPVGIIGCNWGGTTASAWVPEKVLATPELNYYLDEYEQALGAMSASEMKKKSLEAWKALDDPKGYKAFEVLLYGLDRAGQLEYMEKTGEVPMVPMGPYNENRPCGLYETMLSKFIPYSVAGAIWYQGESDCGDRAKTYDLLLKGLVQSWREAWDDDFPFIVVQLAPFKEWLECTSAEYCLVRAKQQLVADTMEGVYMTSIMDIGSYDDIHPKEKMEVGRRLALLALSHVYDKLSETKAENPRYESGEIKGNTISLKFTNTENLSISDNTTTIEIKEGAKEIAPKEVTANGDTVTLLFENDIAQADDVSVAFGWDDYAVITIKNEQGLPIAPFKVSL
jgi:sialate O-acetylesterase